MAQLLLFEDPRPLVERLGREFFRQAPEGPGVYLMRDRADRVVYVGKAKNLRRRLGSYRVANADRVPRRHLRLLREVARIELDLCPTESAALAREAKLLRELKPRFNRAGVWPGKARFLAWRFAGQAAQFTVEEIPPPGWERFGPLGAGAPRLLGALARLIWLALNPRAGFSALPCGWAQNRFPLPVTIACGAREGEVWQALEGLCRGDLEGAAAWLLAAVEARGAGFERTAGQADFEAVENLVTNQRGRRVLS
jgi:predicted GIY-YIG superfamily endonuclease